MSCFNDKNAWQSVAIFKYRNAKMRKTKKSIVFVDNRKIVATFNLTNSKGVVL